LLVEAADEIVRLTIEPVAEVAFLKTEIERLRAAVDRKE
jgi:hypothetical protein